MEVRECEACGAEFRSAAKGRSRFCSSKCGVADYRANKKAQHHKERPHLAGLMDQPEIQNLRAGIQEAIRTAWKRAFPE